MERVAAILTALLVAFVVTVTLNSDNKSIISWNAVKSTIESVTTK